MLSKRLVYNQLVTKVNAIDTKIPGTSGLITKAQDDPEKQNFRKMFSKRYLLLGGLFIRLTTKQTLQKFKKIYLVLLGFLLLLLLI